MRPVVSLYLSVDKPNRSGKAIKYKTKLSRYGLQQIEYLGYTFNRQLGRGSIVYYRCALHKKGHCKARISLKNGVLKEGTTTQHNHVANMHWPSLGRHVKKKNMPLDSLA